MVLHLYDSKAALKMGTKLESEGDVEGAVDMMGLGEERVTLAMTPMSG